MTVTTLPAKGEAQDQEEAQVGKSMRKFYGRGLIDGLTMAGVPNPSEFLMNQNRLRAIYQNQSGTAKKALAWLSTEHSKTLGQILATMNEAGHHYPLNVVQGTMKWLVEAGLVKEGPEDSFTALYAPAIRARKHDTPATTNLGDVMSSLSLKSASSLPVETPAKPSKHEAAPAPSPAPVAAIPKSDTKKLTQTSGGTELMSKLAEESASLRRQAHALIATADAIDNLALDIATRVEAVSAAETKLKALRDAFATSLDL